MIRLALPAAVLLATVAAWLSQATLAVTGDAARVGLLPLSTAALLAAAAAGALIAGARRASLPLAPVALLTLVVLPWLPVPLPPALLVWSGAIVWFVWAATAILLLSAAVPRIRILTSSTTLGSVVRKRPQLSAGVLAFAIFAASAWQVAPSIPGGDEPHYLVITQSLLRDGDLQIENNHRRGDYLSYYAGALAPHYIRRGRNQQIYSIHAPGLSAVVAPAFAVGGYRGVVLFLLVLSAAGSALAWHLGYLATRRVGAAWFGWAAVTCSATAIFHSFAVYPDGLGGVIALTGVWALFRADEERRSGDTRLGVWCLHGTALALLPWLHSRFALLAGSLGALILLRLASTRHPAGKAVAFLSVPAVAALGWITFFLVVYGKPDPSAPYGAARDVSLAFVPGGLTGLLFDQRFGLVANAPVLAFALVGLVAMLGRRRPGGTDRPAIADRRLALELLFVIVPYLVTATSYAMWWAGGSAPARFANPAVFMLAIPCAALWATATHRATRIVAAGALAFTVCLSVVLVTVDGGRLAYNSREATALWLDWASQVTALGAGVPVWYRGSEGIFARDVAVWLVAAALAYAATRAAARVSWLRDRTAYATAAGAIFTVGAMAALSGVWVLHRVEGLPPAAAQLDLLRRLGHETRAAAVRLTPPGTLDRDGLLSLIRLESPLRQASAPGMGRNEQPLAAFPSIPAGRYRLRVETHAPGGWLLVGIGRDQFALRSEALGAAPAPIEITFPVDVRALLVRGDEDARRTLRRVIVEPLALVPPDRRLTDRVARRAVRYDAATVYFLDDGCFPEPEAFWIGGARECSFVIQPAGPPAPATVRLRNAPVENTLTLESAQWRESLTLAAGDERQLEIPIAPGRDAMLVTARSRAGFRPSQSNPASRDERFLGVQVTVGSR